MLQTCWGNLLKFCVILKKIIYVVDFISTFTVLVVSPGILEGELKKKENLLRDIFATSRRLL